MPWGIHTETQYTPIETPDTTLLLCLTILYISTSHTEEVGTVCMYVSLIITEASGSVADPGGEHWGSVPPLYFFTTFPLPIFCPLKHLCLHFKNFWICPEDCHFHVPEMDTCWSVTNRRLSDLCKCIGKVIFIPKTDGFTWIDESALVEVDKCWGV